ncbi:TraR/DksA C4-type zinc finger protein [Salinisphaera hydrothermalis]|uniref:TraR/DksA C4-type zinc finger protein n=1 Tax=Salinisphaera hydrothermalis TaxID=563188 RepID=UPI00333FC77D
MNSSDNAADCADKAVGLFYDQSMAPHIRRQIQESALPINWLGLCDDCGEHINPARLEANPRAVRCVPCQDERERHEARR